ncbi:ion channel regulatory protein UNC-93 domain-containing protein [Phthorimaea operculella]|nr:ion channel regulatory protein UNC-93 domain-containing protein [Phthorimaea operculella]
MPDVVFGTNEKWRINRNIFVLGFAFMIQFTAFHGTANLQSSVNSDDGAGTFTLAAIYFSLILSNIFLPAIVIKWLGCKWAVAFSFIAYMPFICAQFYPRLYTLVPAGMMVGFGGGPLWCAKCTYLSVVAEPYSKLSGIPADVLVVRFFGLFFMFYQMAQIWGNLVSSAILSSSLGDVPTFVNETLAPTASALLNATNNVTAPALAPAVDYGATCGVNFCSGSASHKMPPITRKMAKSGVVTSAAAGSTKSQERVNVTEPTSGPVPPSTGSGDAASYHSAPDSLTAATSAPMAAPESQFSDTLRPPSHTERTPPQPRDSAHTRGPSHSEIAPRPNRDDVSNTSRHRSVRTVASTASIQARKLAAEAEFQRKQMERERALAKQERERERALADLERAVEEKEFHAQLAAIEANTDKSSRSRSSSSHSTSLANTQAWVDSCVARHVDNTAANQHVFTDTLRPQPPHGTPMERLPPQAPNMNAQPHRPIPPEQWRSQVHVTNSQPHRLAPVEYLWPWAGNTAAAHHAANPTNVPPMQAPPIEPQLSQAQEPSLAAALHALAASQNHRSSKSIELPPFSGKPNEWLIFKRTYDDTKPNYSALDNLARLRNAVRGEAREALSSLLFSAESPCEIIDALELHFARPELIVQQEVAALRSLPKLSTDFRDLNKFACKIRNSVATIKSLRQNQYLHSPELFSSVLNKLNVLLKSRWCDYAKERHQTFIEQNNSKLELLSQFLLSEADTQIKFCAELDAVPPAYHSQTHQHAPAHKTFRPQERTLLKIVPVVVSGPAGEYATHAFLDDGSTATLIDDTVAARIGATGPLQPLSIAGIGGMTRNTVANIVDFYIKGRNSKERYLIKNAKRMKSLNLSTQSLYERELRAFPHLSDLVNELTHVNVTPTILIGSKDWYLTLSREIREGKRSDPVAVRTSLGWTLHGAVSSQSKPVEFVNHLTWNGPEPIRHASFSTPDPIHSKLDDLTSMMKEQYKLDAIGITERAPRLSKDEERAIEILESTARRLPSGRFEVGLPWRDIDKSKLPIATPRTSEILISRKTNG